MLKKIVLSILSVFFISGFVSAQEFGFGFAESDDYESESGAYTGAEGISPPGRSGAPSVSIGGEVSASLIGYVNDFTKGVEETKFGDIFQGKLNFSAGVSVADAVIKLNLSPSLQSPVTINEAYLRAYFGGFEIEAGLRKLTWGKADSFGPLDVINPLDYSQLTDISDLMNFKIAMPMIHLSYRIGSFSKIEGVFVPFFKPMLSAEKDSRWYPAQMRQMDKQLGQLNKSLSELNGLFASLPAGVKVPELPDKIAVNVPDTSSLDYLGAGLRFTATIGPADIGAQYYYGRLTRPAVYMTVVSFPTVPSYIPLPSGMPSLIPTSVNYEYNPYHQIGVDWAQVVFGFNIRAEFAANITYDFSGDDGKVYNPHLAWSFGFDRVLFWGISLSFQCNETIRLLHDKISKNQILDTEAGADITSTQIIASVSKKFLRDQLELRAAFFWEIEGGDVMIIPSIIWTLDALSAELSGGIFTGNKDGQFGQYWKNSFIKASLTFSF